MYETQSEQLRAGVQFIRTGLDRGEKCIYAMDENTMAGILGAMRAGGIDVDSAARSGALSVVSTREAYFRNGCFDPDMLCSFREAAALAKAQGFRALRVAGEMTWEIGAEIGISRLMEYEAKVNRCFRDTDVLGLCLYNRSRFSPEVIRDLIRTHPLVLYGRMVCRNMYYLPPDEFLGRQKASREVERLLRNMRDRQSAEEELRRIGKELRRKAQELERKTRERDELFHVFVHREARMAELKARIRELENKLNGRKGS
jgi:hypothetical protein